MMKALKNCKINIALLICLNYFIVSISTQGANIASIIYFQKNAHNIGYQGFITQGCFYTGSIIGSILTSKITISFSHVKPLILCTLLVSLYPIILPTVQL